MQTMGNFAWSDASSSVKEAQSADMPHLVCTPPPNCSQVPKGSWTKHWDSGSIQDWLETAELVGPRVYSCHHCRNHVCLHDDIISKAFQGRNGRAFLSYHAMNVTTGAKEDRQLMTGLHTVADIHCCDCQEVLGWKYERAYEEYEKYKEGRFIFEKVKIMQENLMQTMGNFASRDASSSVKEAQRVSATSCTPPVNCCQVPKDSRRKHWDSGSIQDWLEMAELVGPRVYSCRHCRNHVCLHDEIISKAFQGRNGRAFLSYHAMNVTTGANEDRQLMTGLHMVADINCCDCQEVLGWKYERTYEESQKYKEGKFILEMAKIVQENW